jgi:hypothetical protein
VIGVGDSKTRRGSCARFGQAGRSLREERLIQSQQRIYDTGYYSDVEFERARSTRRAVWPTSASRSASGGWRGSISARLRHRGPAAPATNASERG